MPKTYYYKNRYKSFILSAILLGSVSINGAVAQDVASPFAGTAEVDKPASRELSYPAAHYEKPKVSVSGTVAATARQESSAQLIQQQVANQIQSQLPAGVTLRQGSAAFVAIGSGEATREAAPEEPTPEEMDPEQAEQLNEVVDPEQLRELTPQSRQRATVRKWMINHPVNYRGVPVARFSDVVSVVSASGDIQYLRKRNLPTSLDATSPSVSAEQAVEAARSDAGQWAADADADAPRLEVWVEETLAGRLAWTVELRSRQLEAQKARRYWIAAVGEPQVLYWDNLVHNTHHGQVTGTIWPGSSVAGAPVANEELPELDVKRSSGGTATTGANGLYVFGAGVGNVTIKATLDGPNSKIDNIAGAELVRSKNGTPANPIDLTFNASGDEQLAQTSAFYWTNRAHDLAKDILAAADLPNLPTNVNLNGQCNAFWNGSSINFFKAGGGCPNMALSDVVFHEYGHGVDARKGGILNGGYSEGFGDAMAVLGTRQSCVGRDFFGPGTCLREASDIILWPPGPGDGVHSQGRRYAGFTWELIQQLKSTYSNDAAYAIASQLVMAAAAANPSDIPDAVHLSFIADDDDGDLTNGTPHFQELAAAADSRNIPRPPNPDVRSGRMGFAWAHNRTAASYTPSPTYAFNSSGGAITATRSGLGRYAIRFSGLGGNGKAGGNVQVTAYGADNRFCKVYWWSSGGADFAANVRCFKPNGKRANARYTILITWP